MHKPSTNQHALHRGRVVTHTMSKPLSCGFNYLRSALLMWSQLAASPTSTATKLSTSLRGIPSIPQEIGLFKSHKPCDTNFLSERLRPSMDELVEKFLHSQDSNPPVINSSTNSPSPKDK